MSLTAFLIAVAFGEIFNMIDALLTIRREEKKSEENSRASDERIRKRLTENYERVERMVANSRLKDGEAK